MDVGGTVLPNQLVRSWFVDQNGYRFRWCLEAEHKKERTQALGYCGVYLVQS